MKIKKVHLVGVIGLLLIAGLVLSPVVNVAAIGTFTDENGRIVHPVVNPNYEPTYGVNQLPEYLRYNDLPSISIIIPISEWYEGIDESNNDIITKLTPIINVLKGNQYSLWLMKYSNK